MPSRFAPILLAFLLSACAASPSDTGLMVYRTVGERELSVEVFAPPGTTRGAGLPAIVFIHGGAWYMGSPDKVHPMSRYLVSRGMVAVAVEYRLSDEAAITPIEALEDARAAMTWIRSNADRLGIDSHRIAAGGYSAGGQLAVMTAVPTTTEPGTGHRPDALVLWFPSLSAHTDPDFQRLLQDKVDPTTLSPITHAGPGLPPTIILQGSSDRVTRAAVARDFCATMTSAGDRCDLHIYKNRGHMFFNDPDDYVDTLLKIDAFLVSLGFLEGEADAEAARSSRDAPESS
jgi:acetyl esterase